MDNQEKQSPNSAKEKVNVFEGLDPKVRARTKKMLMAFIIFAIVMLFGGFTSAYILSNIGSFWVHINAPAALWWSNAIILVSSITLILANRSMKNGQAKQSIVFLALTLVLGVAFTLTQQAGWAALKEKGMGYSVNLNEQGLKAYRWNSFDQITGVYGADYTISKDGQTLVENKGELYAADDVLLAEPLGGKIAQTTNSSSSYILVLILVHILHLVFGLAYLVINLIRSYTGVIHPGDTVRLYTNGMYWHFLGILWVYLFAFLFLIH
jgi:heme/copper-type cytochrome/quinol oxidase subunit 3